MTASSYAALDGPFRRQIEIEIEIGAASVAHVSEFDTRKSRRKEDIVANNRLSVCGVASSDDMVSEDDIEEW